MSEEGYRGVIQRLRKLDEDAAKIPGDMRPLHKRLGNDIELINKLEPHTERWMHAWTRIRMELKEVAELERSAAKG